MLAGRDDDRLVVLALAQGEDQRDELDRLGPGADDDRDHELFDGGLSITVDLSVRPGADLNAEIGKLGAMSRSQKGLAAFFTLSGVLHFVIPRSYEAIMPPSLPRHREAVALSGVAEIVGGLAVAHPRSRRFARWSLLALLVAVFPANIHMAVNPEQVRGLNLDRVPRWALWARLPLQPLCMLWVWRATRD